MTKKETIHIKAILERIKNPDGHVEEAIASCDKQLAIHKSASQGLRPDYELEDRTPW